MGFYPLTHSLSNVINGPGIVKQDRRTPIDSITIQTEAWQDAAIQKFIDSHSGSIMGSTAYYRETVPDLLRTLWPRVAYPHQTRFMLQFSCWD